MSFTKTKIFNLACSALLLSRQISDTESDIVTNEVRVLNTFWEDALILTLQDLDLDSLSETITLELIEELSDGPWTYVYKYPTRCSFLRRIVSGAITDTNRTFINKRVALHNGQKVIFTDEYQASIECVTKDISLDTLSSPAAYAVAYKLALLANPLITGKGAKALKDDIYKSYTSALIDAQKLDKLENFSYDPVHLRSEFVASRLE